MKRLAILGLVGLAALSLVAAAVAWSLAGLDVPARAGAEPDVFEVTSGESLGAVARRLEAEGLLPQRWLFSPRVLVAWARWQGVDRDVKSGEYDLAASMTPREILERLVDGSVKTHPVTLPEGLRLDEVAQRLEEAGVTSAAGFLARARDAEFARRWGIEGGSFEGYLYPETYRFRRDSTPDEVIERMYREFSDRLSEQDRAAIEASEMTLHQVVTLASIVEKETSVAEERGLVAAVYRNRLKKRMRLQSDPTVIYGIVHTRGEFDGDIRYRDLREDNVYNTYTRAGLPAGPISSTTVESIRAVLAPADTGFLYFVSRNDGTHKFSHTLREHTNAVNRYQRRGRSGPS